jgi:hypothetical protein
VRIENVQPRGSLEYSLSSVHWLDAISPPVEAHITKLAERLRTMLHLPVETGRVPPRLATGTDSHESPAEIAAVVAPAVPPTTTGKQSSSKRMLIIGVAAIAGLGVLAYALSDRPPAPVSTSAGSTIPTSTVTPPPPPTPTSVRPKPSSTPVPPPNRTTVPPPKVTFGAFPTHQVIREIDQREISRLKVEARAHPNDERPAIALGDIYYDARQYDSAIIWYKDALGLTPNDLDVRIDLAMAYWHSQQHATAMSHLRRVLAIRPGHPLALLNMGVVHATSNSVDAAADCWRGVIQYNPGTAAAERARQLLGRIGR